MLPGNISDILKEDKIDETGQSTLLEFLRKKEVKVVDANNKEDFSQRDFTKFLTAIAGNDISKLSKEKARTLVDVISSAIISLDSKEAKSLLEHSTASASNIFFLTVLCTKAEYFEPLSTIQAHVGCRVLDFCNRPVSTITDWKNSIQSPQDLINKYVKDKHAEFSAWKALKFLGTVAGCAVFVWGNIQPILKENQKLNALVACLGLSAVVVSGFSSYFFKVDPASHGVPNELFTAR